MYSYELGNTAPTIPLNAPILTLPADRAGMVIVICVLLRKVSGTTDPATLITVASTKFSPKRVTRFPPSISPDDGETLVRVGITSALALVAGINMPAITMAVNNFLIIKSP
jgi:hypothetical protein